MRGRVKYATKLRSELSVGSGLGCGRGRTRSEVWWCVRCHSRRMMSRPRRGRCRGRCWMWPPCAQVSCNLGVRGHRHGGSHLKYFSRGHQLTPLGGHGGDDGGRRAIPFSSPVVAWVCVFFATVVLVVGVVEEENVRMVGGGIGEMP